jgi:arsenic resistance protein ArsH
MLPAPVPQLLLLLRHFGAKTRVFDPDKLPLLDSVPASHPKMQ